MDQMWSATFDPRNLAVRFGGRGKAYLCPYPYRHPKKPSRRVRCDSCRCAHRFDDWSDGISNAKTKNIYVVWFSVWIHQTFPNLRNFAWQQGYGAFSVGISQVQETVHYIEQQLEHHRTRTFQEENLAFLKKHGVHFDEKYLWD